MPATIAPTKVVSSTTAVPNTTPQNISNGSATAFTQCHTGWTDWINEKSPSISPTNFTYEFEKMNDMDLTRVCPGGVITDIQCVDAVTGATWVYPPEGRGSCNIDHGFEFVCLENSSNEKKVCIDHKIRYMCNCSTGKCLHSV